MKIYTKYFGEISVKEDAILTFPQGLPGFVEEKQFVLLPLENNPVFQVLQSTKNTDPAFIVVNPYHFIKEYAFDLDDNLLELLEITSQNDVLVLTIVSLKEPFESSTVNLQAPVIINQTKKKGKQYILNTKDYSTKEQIFSNQLTSQVKGD